MQEREITIKLQVYDNAAELPAGEADLVSAAQAARSNAYAPYSGYKVGAAAILSNGAVITGANQENAAYPMCVCAEVAMLNSCASQYPGVTIQKMAISTQSIHHKTKAGAPCGQCRQTILEYETRFGSDIAIILSGEEGPLYKVGSVKDLLPLHFSAADL
jgi:cytidine deaminase